MTLNVVVTGAFSTGKTTLIEALDLALRTRQFRVTLVPDVARSCPFPLNQQQTDAASIWLTTTQISRELSASAASPEIILCDRGIPDILAHQEDLLSSGRGAGLEPMRPFLEKWCGTYDIVLATAVDENLPPLVDGLRVTDSGYRAHLNQCSDLVLGRMGIEARLPNEPAARVRHALEMILVRLGKD